MFWTSVSPASGSASGTVSVSVNPANLAAGTYTGNVQVTGAPGSPASVAMTLVVQGTQAAGTITGVANGGSFATGLRVGHLGLHLRHEPVGEHRTPGAPATS